VRGYDRVYTGHDVANRRPDALAECRPGSDQGAGLCQRDRQRPPGSGADSARWYSEPRPDYHYLVAKALTLGWPDEPERSAALRTALGGDWQDDDVVAAGILRPGYSDPSGDRSSG